MLSIRSFLSSQLEVLGIISVHNFASCPYNAGLRKAPETDCNQPAPEMLFISRKKR